MTIRPGTPALPARPGLAALIGAALLAPCPAVAEEVGSIGVDWIGNDIVIEALADPEVAGVTCHLAYFERSTIDRLVQGNWFEDPSNSSIACRQTGPITLGDISRGPEGEEIFSERQSLLLKTLSITRIFDEANQTLIYVAHAREVTEGSAKMSISTVPLWAARGAE
ncbi:MAG: CreA family protein [Paracoccaceae bacterium]